MSRKFIIILLIILAAIGGSFWYWSGREQAADPAPVADPAADEAAVRAVVGEFGKRLKNVFITAPDASEQIRAQYGDLISADLLAAWQKEPIKAPGQLKTNSVPQEIVILEVSLTEDGAYEVQGKVVESAGQYTVALKLRNREGRWIITGFLKAIMQ